MSAAGAAAGTSSGVCTASAAGTDRGGRDSRRAVTARRASSELRRTSDTLDWLSESASRAGRAGGGDRGRRFVISGRRVGDRTAPPRQSAGPPGSRAPRLYGRYRRHILQLTQVPSAGRRVTARPAAQKTASIGTRPAAPVRRVIYRLPKIDGLILASTARVCLG